MEKVVRGIKVGLREAGKEVGKLCMVYDGSRGVGYAELYVSHKFIEADIYYESTEVRIEIYRPEVHYLNNRVFKIVLNTRPNPKSPVAIIGEQLKNSTDLEGVDYIYDDF